MSRDTAANEIIQACPPGVPGEFLEHGVSRARNIRRGDYVTLIYVSHAATLTPDEMMHVAAQVEKLRPAVRVANVSTVLRLDEGPPHLNVFLTVTMAR